MNRENGRKNSRRILGGDAGFPKIYVGRLRRGASADLRAENWRPKIALPVPPVFLEPKNQITNLEPPPASIHALAATRRPSPWGPDH